jgi:hypothetical protein
MYLIIQRTVTDWKNCSLSELTEWKKTFCRYRSECLFLQVNEYEYDDDDDKI